MRHRNFHGFLAAALMSLMVPALTGCGPKAHVLEADDPHLKPLAWMVGSWFSEDGEGTSLEEHWIQPAGGTMLGVNRTIRGSRTVFFEYLRIERAPEGIVLLASPLGRPPTPFTLTELTDERVVFENLEHDFPQRVIYWREDDRLHARIEGQRDGINEATEWVWDRAETVRR